MSALHIRLKLVNEPVEGQRLLLKRGALEHVAELARAVGRQQMSHIEHPGIARRRNRNDAEQIETEVGQVGQRLLAERLIMELGANQPEPTQRPGAGAEFGQCSW